MNLYRFEVETEEETKIVVVAANNDEEAFRIAEIEVEKSTLVLPIIKDISLLERKLIRKSAAFVLSL